MVVVGGRGPGAVDLPVAMVPTPVASALECYETDTRFLFFLSSFLLSYIYTYKDHSLRIVVRRPYSGLTIPPIFFLLLLTFTSADYLVATVEHCLVFFRTESGLARCLFPFLSLLRVMHCHFYT